MSLNPSYANNILNHLFSKETWTAPTSVYVSAHTGNPGTTGANEHGSTGSYSRATTTSSDWASASSGSISNVDPITFPSATQNYTAKITHFGLWTAKTGGTFIGAGALTSGITITTGDDLLFDVGSISISLT